MVFGFNQLLMVIGNCIFIILYLLLIVDNNTNQRPRINE